MPPAFSISPGLREMVRESFGLSLRRFPGTVARTRSRSSACSCCAPALQQPGVGSIPHKHVLEGIDRLWYLAPAEYQLRSNQLGKGLLQFLFGQPRYGAQQLVGELATHHGADLGHLPHRRQSVEPRHQRGVQRRRNRQRRQRMLEHIMAVPLLQQPAFEHRLGQLLDEQRYAIGAGEDLVRHLLGKRLAGRDPLDDRRPDCAGSGASAEASSHAHDLARAA